MILLGISILTIGFPQKTKRTNYWYLETFCLFLDRYYIMIIIDATKYGSIDQALKVYKNKVTKTKLINQLRERQAYVKPSVVRRKEVLGAIYKQKAIDSSNE